MHLTHDDARPYNTMHAVCPAQYKQGLVREENTFSKELDNVEAEHLPTQVSYGNTLADDKLVDEFLTVCAEIFASQTLHQLTVMQGKKLDVEVLGWPG